MTMDFKLPPKGLPGGIATGDKVDFEFTMDAANSPQLTGIRLLAPDSKPQAAVSASKP